MGRRRAFLAACTTALVWTLARGQDNDTVTDTDADTCVTDSCGISTCQPGYELEVTLDSSSLLISCNPCDEDYYKPDESADACTPCGEGLVASGGASVCTLESGYWRLTNTSEEVYECSNADACVGGSDVSNYCAEGFEGPLCAVCSSDYYPSGSLDCLACTTANTASTIITIVIFAAVVILFVMVLVKGAEMIEEKAREEDDDANEESQDKALAAVMNTKVYEFLKKWKDTLLVRFKIIIAHFQIVTTFPVVLDVTWPESFNRYADKFSILTLDFWGILTQTCFFRADFLKQLVFTTLLPLAIVAVVLVFYFKRVKTVGASASAKKAAWDSTAGAVLLTGFFFYIVTSTLVLKSFDCQEFEDGSSYLRADYSISCDSQTYDFIYGYAITMAIIFPAGIPTTYLAVLYIGRQRINPDPLHPEVSLKKREEDPTIQKTKFLWGTYRPAVYFYEVWECVRKLFLTGLLVYFEEGTATQVVIAMLITLAGLRVLAGLRPYRREDENNLAEASIWVTFLTLLAGLLIKSQVAEEDGYDTVALGVVLTLMNMSLVALAVFQIVWTTSVYFKEKWSEFFGLEGKEEGSAYKSSNDSRLSQSGPSWQERRAPHSSPTTAGGRSQRVTDASGRNPPRARSPVPMDYPVSRKSDMSGGTRPMSTSRA